MEIRDSNINKNTNHSYMSRPKGKDAYDDKFNKNIGEYSNKTHDRIDKATTSESHKQEVNSRIKKLRKDKKFYFMLILLSVILIGATMFGVLVYNKNTFSGEGIH